MFLFTLSAVVLNNGSYDWLVICLDFKESVEKRRIYPLLLLTLFQVPLRIQIVRISFPLSSQKLKVWILVMAVFPVAVYFQTGRPKGTWKHINLYVERLLRSWVNMEYTSRSDWEVSADVKGVFECKCANENFNKNITYFICKMTCLHVCSLSITLTSNYWCG